jgi:hypothetical protein
MEAGGDRMSGSGGLPHREGTKGAGTSIISAGHFPLMGVLWADQGFTRTSLRATLRAPGEGAQ